MKIVNEFVHKKSSQKSQLALQVLNKRLQNCGILMKKCSLSIIRLYKEN